MLKKILFILNPNQRKNFYFLGFYNILNSLFELLGLISLSVIVLLIVNPETYIEKLTNFDLYNYIFSPRYNYLENINFSLYFFSIVFLFTTILKFLVKYISIKFSVNLSLEIGNILFKNYINKKYIHLFDSTSSKLLNLVNYHANRFSNSLVNPVINLVSSFSLMLILLISFIVIGGIKIIISLGFIFVICLIIYLVLGKTIAFNERKIIESDIIRQNILNESFNNIKYLKLSKKYFNLLNEYQDYGAKYGKGLIFNQISLHLAKPLLEVIFLIIAIIFVNINLNNRDSNLIEYLPLISFFLLSFYRLIPSVQVMYQSFVHIKGSLGTLDDIEKELSQKHLQEQNYKNEDLKEIKFTKNISLKNINFNYTNKKKLFYEISLDIKKNSCVAFFGKSGQGKTTLVDIICTLIDPDKGDIFIDNEKINDKNKLSYQNKIGYLSQNFYIVNDTLIKNITFYDAKGDDNKEKAKYYLYKLFEKQEIENLIHFEEKIGENGVKLSQGQRQRLLIVRLLYENKEILILDEPASSLDLKNILKLKGIIKELKKTKTIILTSHNKEILKVCDKIFFVEDNKIKNIEIDSID
jgi:ABC-type bacteriocin/lantibiotic exporter with double-glycine peptidase domain